MNNSTLEPVKATVLWVGEPKFRGTFGIFSLCLSTLVICVWSAVHLDIPTKRQSKIVSFFMSFFWMLAALFCPELLLLISFNQRKNAKGLVKKAKKCFQVVKQKESKNFLVRLFSFRFNTDDMAKVSRAPDNELWCDAKCFTRKKVLQILNPKRLEAIFDSTPLRWFTAFTHLWAVLHLT